MTARLVCAVLGIYVGWVACSVRHTIRSMRALERFLATRDPADLFGR